MSGLSDYTNAVDSPGDSIEQRQAKAALRRLRAENVRRRGRFYRAATLAEAEAIAAALQDTSRTPRAVMREHGLTCKAPPIRSAYSQNHGAK